MNKYKPSVTLFLDNRTLKSSGKYPLKLTVYCKPFKKRYGTNIDLTKDEWNKINGDRLRDEDLKETKIKINALLAKAENVLSELKPFSFIKFEELFIENSTNGKPTQIDPLPPNETDPPRPFQIDPLIPAQTDPLKA